MLGEHSAEDSRELDIGSSVAAVNLEGLVPIFGYVMPTIIYSTLILTIARLTLVIIITRFLQKSRRFGNTILIGCFRRLSVTRFKPLALIT